MVAATMLLIVFEISFASIFRVCLPLGLPFRAFLYPPLASPPPASEAAPLFALRPHPALPKCWRDGGVGAAMRRLAAAEGEGIWAHAGREWLAARLADLLSAITRGEQVFAARIVAD